MIQPPVGSAQRKSGIVNRRRADGEEGVWTKVRAELAALLVALSEGYQEWLTTRGEKG